MATNWLTLLGSSRYRYFTLGIAILGVGLVCGAVSIFGLRQRPVLRVSTKEVRLGAAQVRELLGRKPSATFDLWNEGNRDLQIRVEYASCACTVRDFGKQRILKPGERAVLTIETSVPPAGVNAAAVELTTNDPSQQVVRLRLVVESDRQPPYVRNISPTRLLLWSTDGLPVTGQVFCQTMELSDAHWIKDVRCDLPGLAIDPPEVETVRVQDGVLIREYRFRVTTATSITGSRGSIQLVSSAGQPLASVDVQLEPTLPIRLTPSPLVFICDDDQATSTKTVMLLPSGMGSDGFRINAE
jgi:hypothetical protein